MKESTIKLNTSKEAVSGVELDIPDIEQGDELQRTKQWRMERLGRWTGSMFKDLMSCNRSAGKLPWDDEQKVFLYGEGLIKTVYEKAKEREKKRYIDSGPGTTAMRYGTRVEPLIFSKAKKALKKLGIKGKAVEVGFIQFPHFEKAGVSSDAKLVVKKKTKASLEFKACAGWNTHYDRTYEPMNAKSTDWWQVQGQMIANDVDICYYAVAEPPTDIAEYTYYEGDIKDLQKQWNKECGVSVETVHKSELHCKVLMQRILICETALISYNDKLNPVSLKQALDNAVEMYKKEWYPEMNL